MQLARLARRRRFDQIVELIPRHARILDVGGELGYWHTVDWQAIAPREIVLLNLSAPNVPAPFSSVIGDARDLSRYPDQSFDLVLAHSVLGHVGSYADQLRMAREVRRVGKAFLVQTPNFWFPLDWHTLVPCFHWLPRRLQAWCFAHVRVGTYPKAQSAQIAWHRATRIRNVTAREVREMFPGATVYRERIAGLTKSLTIHGTNSYAPMSHVPSDPRVTPSLS